MTRGLATGPDRFEGSLKDNSLSSSGRPSVESAAGERLTWIILKGHIQFREISSKRNLLSAPFCSPCMIVAAVLYTSIPPPAAYWGDDDGVLYTHEFIGAFMVLATMIAISEMVAVEALSITVLSIENSEREAW